MTNPNIPASLEAVTAALAKIRSQLERVIIGQQKTVDMILAALLLNGHVLLEGVPGTAKTLLVKTLAVILGGSFQRIQLTPDLMPSDIVGINVYDPKTGQFNIQKGPIFADFVLADEINRAPAKTQSALLECMAERQVTIEGQRLQLSKHFMLVATQNPLEYEGTYPLPEAQLDRFLFKLLIPCPDTATEKELLNRYENGFRADRLEELNLKTVTSEAEISDCQQAVAAIATREPVIDYILNIVGLTRQWGSFLVGCGPRASIGLLLASKAMALLEGRDYVTPDDVKAAVLPVLRHRVILRPEAEMDGLTADRCLESLTAQVKVPR